MAKRVDAERPNTISEKEFLGLMAELVRAERDKDDATTELAGCRGVISGIIKRAKNAGANVDALRALASLEKMEEDERMSLMRDTALYAAWKGVRLWQPGTDSEPQGVMFGDDEATKEARQGLLDARVHGDGYNSRKEGATADDNPHPAGSRDHQTWAKAWGDADFDLGDKPASKVETASTARKGAKRGTVVPTGDAPVAPKRGRPKALPAPTVN